MPNKPHTDMTPEEAHAMLDKYNQMAEVRAPYEVGIWLGSLNS